MKIGSLFSGIGGLELGLERAGVGQVVWQCEIDPFCREVLAKHWPHVTRFDDVTQPRSYPHADVVCGGFPCQDVSPAGLRRGIGGARSGLWWHFASVIDQVRPRFVVVENVAGGAKAWLPHVGAQLWELGYRARAFRISAFDVGAPHRRARVFVLARHTDRERRPTRRAIQLRARHEQRAASSLEWNGRSGIAADSSGLAVGVQPRGRSGARGADSGELGFRSAEGPTPDQWRWSRDSDGTWTVEPPVCGVAHGVPRRVDRLRSLGNSVVPQCAEIVGRMIAAAQHKGAAKP